MKKDNIKKITSHIDRTANTFHSRRNRMKNSYGHFRYLILKRVSLQLICSHEYNTEQTYEQCEICRKIKFYK